MTPRDDASLTPKDATQMTEDQRELAELFHEQGRDPDAPGGHQTGADIADES